MDPMASFQFTFGRKYDCDEHGQKVPEVEKSEGVRLTFDPFNATDIQQRDIKKQPEINRVSQRYEKLIEQLMRDSCMPPLDQVVDAREVENPETVELCIVDLLKIKKQSIGLPFSSCQLSFPRSIKIDNEPREVKVLVSKQTDFGTLSLTQHVLSYKITTEGSVQPNHLSLWEVSGNPTSRDYQHLMDHFAKQNLGDSVAFIDPDNPVTLMVAVNRQVRPVIARTDHKVSLIPDIVDTIIQQISKAINYSVALTPDQYEMVIEQANVQSLKDHYASLTTGDKVFCKDAQAEWITDDEEGLFDGVEGVTSFSAVNKQYLVRVMEKGGEKLLHATDLRLAGLLPAGKAPDLILAQSPNSESSPHIHRYLNMVFSQAGAVVSLSQEWFDWSKDCPKEIQVDGKSLKVEYNSDHNLFSDKIRLNTGELVFSDDQEECKRISILSFTGWSDDGTADLDPGNYGTILSEIKTCRETIEPGQKLIVHCSSGQGRSGSVIANLILDDLENLTMDNVQEKLGDLVRRMRHERSARVVTTPEQHVMVYREAVAQLQSQI